LRKKSKKETESDLFKLNPNKTYKTTGTHVFKLSKKINVLTCRWNLNNKRIKWNSYRKWRKTKKVYFKKLEKPNRSRTILADW